jgi:hypothetical protein
LGDGVHTIRDIDQENNGQSICRLLNMESGQRQDDQTDDYQARCQGCTVTAATVGEPGPADPQEDRKQQ